MRFKMDFVDKAYVSWLVENGFNVADDAIYPYLSSEITTRQSGWLKQAREALFLSSGEVADRLGISRQAYYILEKNEAVGKISMEKLSHAAEVMDCELIVAIRPKQRVVFSKINWNKILPLAKKHPWVNSRPENKKHLALKHTANLTMNSIEFRRTQKWTFRLFAGLKQKYANHK
jgi:DNA-binding XRE family transcriptional regulator